MRRADFSMRKAHGISAHTIFALCAHNFRAVRIEDFLKTIAEKIENEYFAQQHCSVDH